MNLYTLSDKIVFNVLKDIEYGYLEILTYQGRLIKFGNKDETLKVYSQGEFTDLCRGPHVPSTGLIKHFKLLSSSAAYWRGDEKNQTLQRHQSHFRRGP